MSQQWKVFKERYYRNPNILSLCMPVLLSGNVQSEHVTAGEIFQKRNFRTFNTLRICRPVLLSGNHQSEHVAAGKIVQRTKLL